MSLSHTVLTLSIIVHSEKGKNTLETVNGTLNFKNLTFPKNGSFYLLFLDVYEILT